MPAPFVFVQGPISLETGHPKAEQGEMLDDAISQTVKRHSWLLPKKR
jgi:hypothetical protein